MRVFGIFCAAAAATFSVSAQQLEAPTTADDAGEELSELDRLSRNADDPFAGVIEKQNREPVSVTLRALDKITARYTDITVEMHQIAEFGSLELQPRFCDTRPPEEFPETTAFVEIFDKEFGNRESDLKIAPPVPVEEEIIASDLGDLPVTAIEPLEVERVEAPVITDQSVGQVYEEPTPEVIAGPQATGVNIFRGWMFASSPALNPLEHPVYDVWVIDCQTRSADGAEDTNSDEASLEDLNDALQ